MAGTPPLRKLEYVLAVARERHFGKAAERLHVDPSNLSRQVREVEDELGIEIFVRANHYVAIAEEAVEFIMDLEQMLARFVTEFEKSKRLARLRARRKASTFVIGYSPFVVPTIPQDIRAIQSVRFAKVASLIAIVIGGYGFAHGEPGAKKALAGVAAGTGIAVLAVNVLSWLWGV